MKFTDNRKRVMEFDNLVMGDVFSYNKDFYMKTDDSYEENGNYTNCVCLSNGELDYFKGDTVVMPVDAELVIT